MNSINKTIADELKVKESQVDATVKLIDEGNTIPFIARYRKEVTGGLSDEILRDLGERLNYLRNLETRKEEVKKSIDDQGKLTEEVIVALENANKLAEVEDIYRPYKQKKRTRATIAKEKGLEELANIIYGQQEKEKIEEIAKKFINEEKAVNTVEDAILGAKDIIAENISDNANYRKEIKRFFYRDGIISVKSTKDEKSRWFKELCDLQESIASKRTAKMKDNVYKVLVESEAKNHPGMLSGRTEGNIIIEFSGDSSLIGSFRNVKVTEPLNWILKGELQQ